MVQKPERSRLTDYWYSGSRNDMIIWCLCSFILYLSVYLSSCVSLCPCTSLHVSLSLSLSLPAPHGLTLSFLFSMSLSLSSTASVSFSFLSRSLCVTPYRSLIDSVSFYLSVQNYSLEVSSLLLPLFLIVPMSYGHCPSLSLSLSPLLVLLSLLWLSLSLSLSTSQLLSVPRFISLSCLLQSLSHFTLSLSLS